MLLACGGAPPGGSASTRAPGATGDSDVASPTVDTVPAVTGDTSGPATGPGFEVASAAVAANESPSLAVSADGRILGVAWVQRDAQSYRAVWVALSDDGASFSTPVRVSAADEDVQANWPGGPSLVVDEDRVLVAWVGIERTTVTARVAELARDGVALVGDPMERAAVRMPAGFHSLTYPTLALDTSGSAWLAMVAAPSYVGRLWLAREERDWVVEDLTEGRPGEPPCECCPPALLVRERGEVVVAWRGDHRKEIYLATASATGPFSDGGAVTMSGVEGDLCPLDGPRLFEDADALGVVWSDTRGDDAQVFVSREDMDWAAEPALVDGAPMWRPALAGPADARAIAWEEGLYRPFRYTFVGSGTDRPLVGPGGPMYEVRAGTYDGRGLAVGV